MQYHNISSALEFYGSRGYVYAEDAPWYVGKEAYYATKPFGSKHDTMLVCKSPDKLAPHHEDQFMVASGEQSFIQMMIDGQSLKRHICVTPCFRDDGYDAWHRQYFMKAELINADNVDEGHLLHMIHDACSFFEGFFPAVRIVETGLGYDIQEKGTRAELGSYGIRKVEISSTGQTLRWIYGTACAEPRLSDVEMRHSKLVGR